MSSTHDEWPDKAMYAALLLVLGGTLGALFALVQLSGATIGGDVPRVFRVYPAGFSLGLSVLTIALGIVSFRYQASLYAYVGVATALGSMGALGLVPLIALFSVANLVLSRMEGEETLHDGRILEAHHWPDKALAASLFLLVAGLAALLQGAAVAGGRFDHPVFLASTPAAGAAVDFVAGVSAVVASREVFLQRRAWAGWLGSGLAFLTFGFYVLAPALAMTASVFLALAGRESEFSPPPTATAAQRPPSKAPKARSAKAKARKA